MVGLFAETLYDKLGLDELKEAAMLIRVSLFTQESQTSWSLGLESRRTGSDSFRKYSSTAKKRAYSCNRGHHVECVLEAEAHDQRE